MRTGTEEGGTDTFPSGTLWLQGFSQADLFGLKAAHSWFVTTRRPGDSLGEGKLLSLISLIKCSPGNSSEFTENVSSINTIHLLRGKVTSCHGRRQCRTSCAGA